jgi:hypothetical protein
MTLPNWIEKTLIKLKTWKSPAQAAGEAQIPADKEITLWSNEGGVGLRLREDGAIELSAGDSCGLTFYKDSGTVVLRGKDLITDFTTATHHTDPRSFKFGFQPFSSYWRSGDLFSKAVNIEKQPLTPVAEMWLRNPEVMVQFPEEAVPIPVPLSTLIKPHPLLDPADIQFNQLNNLKKLLKEMVL